MRRFARPFLNLVMACGLLIAAWPVGQTIYGLWSQRTLAAEWQQSAHAAPPKTTRHATRPKSAPADKTKPVTTAVNHDPNSPAPAVTSISAEKPKPWPLTKLSIPSIDLQTYIVQGIDPASLRRGPGHDPNSSLPGQGNCVVAGHRNIYGSLFYRLDELMPGADITLENRDGTFHYLVENSFTITDTDVTVLDPPKPGAPPELTLITCTLPHSNYRIVVQANLSAE